VELTLGWVFTGAGGGVVTTTVVGGGATASGAGGTYAVLLTSWLTHPAASRAPILRTDKILKTGNFIMVSFFRAVPHLARVIDLLKRAVI
jgi:hypothetical protein